MNVRPRLAPPDPSRSAVESWRRAARLCGFRPMPWQSTAMRVVMGTRRERGRDRWVFPEAAVVVARQNGKTSLLVPRIVEGLLRGERIMHTAQNRELPREVFRQVADHMVRIAPGSLDGAPRLANGQESVRMLDGGAYRIVAPSHGGARGPTNDLVIVDEARMFDTFEFVAAARPTLTASPNGQMLYLSNAGEETSVVLNGLRLRAGVDPSLGYVEWSAAPGRSIDDRDGWREANPALGRTIRMATLALARAQLPPAIFETEHLCRWVTSTLPPIVSLLSWQRSAAILGAPSAPFMGVSVDPSGARASAAISWRQSDGTIALVMQADHHGDPLDLDALGANLAEVVRDADIGAVGYDPATDQDLVRFLPDTVPVSGQSFAGACDRFARTVEGGRLRQADAEPIGADLPYTVRRPGLRGAWTVVRARDDRPITGALAAIRAVWLATNPEAGEPAIY